MPQPRNDRAVVLNFLDWASTVVTAVGAHDQLAPTGEERRQLRRHAARAPLEIWRAIGDEQGIASTLIALGNAASRRHDFGRAGAFSQQGLILARSIGDWADTYWALTVLASSLNGRGDHAGTRALLEESLALKLEHGDQWAAGASLMALGELARLQGDHERATGLLCQGLVVQRDVGFRRGVLECLDRLADTSYDHGDIQRAAELFAAGEALREAHGGSRTVGTFVSQSVRQRRQETVEAIRARLSQAAFDAAWADGSSMSLEAAATFALKAHRD